MVSSSVKTMSFLSNQPVSTRKEISSESRTENFAAMMDKSINKAKSASTKDEVKTEYKVEDKSEVREDKVYDEFKEKDVNIEEEKDINNVDLNEEIPEEDVISDEVSEEILTIVATLLNVSVEDIKASLENLGIESKDLLDMENVTKLVMDLKNIDTKLDLLVHEDANDVIKDIQNSLTSFMENVENVIKKDDFVVEESVLIETEDDVIIPKDEVKSTDDAETNDATENVVDKQTTDNTQALENGKEFTGSDEADSNSSKGDKTEKTETTVNSQIGELKDSILNEIENALGERVEETVSTRIVREIADNITLAIREKVTSLEMQLNPESLGKVSILLSNEEGGITAKITAETEMAKNAIEQQLTILKENFEKQGLKVTDIEVTIASHGFEQNLDKNDSRNEGQQKKHSGIRRSLLDEINGIQTEENTTEDIVKETLGNTVSYLA